MVEPVHRISGQGLCLLSIAFRTLQRIGQMSAQGRKRQLLFGFKMTNSQRPWESWLANCDYG